MKIYALLLLSIITFSCKKNNETPIPKVEKEIAPTFQNKGHELVFKMVKKVGAYDAFKKKKDVVYTYTYETPDNKKDISIEKYLFEGELSYGEYTQHERTFPDLGGTIEQGFNGTEFWLKHQGNLIADENRLKRVDFNRLTNFYWFAMFPKLLDPGLTYEYLGEKVLENKIFETVKISFKPSEKAADIYQIYINKETGLVDQFLFTVADFNMMETPLLMQVTYEEVDGLLIPTKRKYKLSTWNADVTDKPWTHVTWTNIKFDNGLKLEDFKK